MKRNLVRAKYLSVIAPAVLALIPALTAQHEPQQERQHKRPPPGILGKVAPTLGVEKWINLPRGAKPPRLENLRGKVVYLYCFQSWCPACHSHGFPLLQKMVKRYAKEKDIVFLAVQTVFEGHDTNTATNARRVAVEKFKLRIPVGHDAGPRGKRSGLMQRFRTGGTPWTVWIDRNGVVRYNGFGTEIKPAKAAERLDALLAENALVGTPIGKLTGLRFDGEPLRFADRDYTLLRWWTDSCQFCRDSLPALEELRARHDGLEVLGVYHAKPIRERALEDVKRDARRLKFSGPVAMDVGWELLRSLRKRGLPTRFTSVSLLVDRAGIIRWVHPGPRLHASGKNSPAGDHPKAAAALAELKSWIQRPIR